MQGFYPFLVPYLNSPIPHRKISLRPLCHLLSREPDTKDPRARFPASIRRRRHGAHVLSCPETLLCNVCSMTASSHHISNTKTDFALPSMRFISRFLLRHRLLEVPTDCCVPITTVSRHQLTYAEELLFRLSHAIRVYAYHSSSFPFSFDDERIPTRVTNCHVRSSNHYHLSPTTPPIIPCSVR
jgi:hypothetical protein